MLFRESVSRTLAPPNCDRMDGTSNHRLLPNRCTRRVIAKWLWGIGMIQYVETSIFESPAQTLVNAVNTVGVMGKGLAAVYKELYPDMFESYKALCVNGQLTIGKLFIYRTENKVIVNLPTKAHWRNSSKVEYISAGLAKFVESYSRFGISSVSFPQLGCGNGELDWRTQVQPVMEQYLGGLPLSVYIHVYSPRLGFVPERLDPKFAKEMRMARSRVPADEIWKYLLTQAATHVNELGMNRGINVDSVDDEHIFVTWNGKEYVVFREEIEDLWALLSLKRIITVSEVSIVNSARDGDASLVVFQLLASLPYIKPIEVMTKRGGKTTKEHGIQYLPLPSEPGQYMAEMLV